MGIEIKSTDRIVSLLLYHKLSFDDANADCNTCLVIRSIHFLREFKCLLFLFILDSLQIHCKFKTM